MFGELLDCADDDGMVAARKLIVEHALKAEGVLSKQRHTSAVSREFDLIELIGTPLRETPRERPMTVAEHMHREGSTRPNRGERARSTIETHNDERRVERE